MKKAEWDSMVTAALDIGDAEYLGNTLIFLDESAIKSYALIISLRESFQDPLQIGYLEECDCIIYIESMTKEGKERVARSLEVLSFILPLEELIEMVVINIGFSKETYKDLEADVVGSITIQSDGEVEFDYFHSDEIEDDALFEMAKAIAREEYNKYVKSFGITT